MMIFMYPKSIFMNPIKTASCDNGKQPEKSIQKGGPKIYCICLLSFEWLLQREYRTTKFGGFFKKLARL